MKYCASNKGKPLKTILTAIELPHDLGDRYMPAQNAYDILIKNGIVYDGTLAEPVSADIGITGDKITAIGRLQEPASRTIDAAGLIVSPGFIDVHTHCDMTFMLSDRLTEQAPTIPSVKGNWNYLYQGVTTVVTGNCGTGFSDLNRWYEILERLKFNTNVYHLAPHGQIRTDLFGDDQPVEPSAGQLEDLKARVAEVMADGAVGLSTGLIYPPGFLTRTDELIELAKVATRYGGLYVSHIRNETGALNSEGERQVIASIKEAIEIGRRAEIPVEISHLKIASPINDMKARQILDLIEEARAEGLDVTADQYPYEASSTGLTAILPTQFVKSGGVKDEYKTSAGRAEMKTALKDMFKDRKPENILISVYRRNNEFEGRNLLEISETLGQDPLDVFIEMVCSDLPPQSVFFEQDISIVREIMREDYILTGSDGGTARKDYYKPHPRSYGTFARKIGQFVSKEKNLSLTQAIRSMTSLPAEKFNMTGRGVIREGAFADIAVIDLDRYTDRATYTEPHQYADGVQYLLVNGVLSIDQGRATDGGGGRALKHT